ncbi:MAG: OprD family outer membrane porin [Campylobacterales bacterium]
MNILRLSLGLLGSILISNSLYASLKTDKLILKDNMQIKYIKVAKSVDRLSDIFENGMFYLRFRTNNFYWAWKNKENNYASGIGGSLVYKTAPLNGISATVAGYTSQNPAWYRMDASDAGIVKAGKDTFSRYRLSTSGDYGISVLGQAYIQADIAKTTIKVGRFLHEGMFTKSNDTKMIPNTFDGVSVVSKDIDKTKLSLTYIAKQKLRDHTTSHDVIAYDGWTQNDDSAVNKNLTVARVGDNNRLIIASVTNTSVKNLKATTAFMSVPDIVSNLAVEVGYSIKINDSLKVIPAFRYMKQFDNLNADYGVANLKAKQDGYTNPNSLDAYLVATKVDIKSGAFMGRIGYSYIGDKADIISPWRSKPTGGFTRAMGQYNWYAKTTTYLFRAGYDFDRADILDGFSIMARYAIQDFDDKKAGVLSDNNILNIDMRQNIKDNLQLKIILGFNKADSNTKDINGDLKSDWSYNEYRVELNYFY